MSHRIRRARGLFVVVALFVAGGIGTLGWTDWQAISPSDHVSWEGEYLH